MRVTVDRNKCLASGQCVVYAGQVFTQSVQEGTVVLLDPSPSRALHAAVVESHLMCPSGAITIEY